MTLSLTGFAPASTRIYVATIAAVSFAILPGCMAAKVASLPVKGVYHTGKIAGKTVYGTGKLAGKTALGTTKLAGKGTIGAAKTVYYVGKVPVEITDRALDTTVKVLTITTLTMTAAGTVVSTARNIQASQLDFELSKYKAAANVVRVFVDVAG